MKEDRHQQHETDLALRGQIVLSGMKNDIPAELDLPAGAPFEGRDLPQTMQMPKDVKELLRPLTDVATNAWRLRKRMVDDKGEPLEETRRLFRFVERMYQALGEAGITIIDKTGKPYDDGMREKVVTYEEVPGLLRDEILETVRPAIRFKEQIIFFGEVIVGIPVVAKEEPAEGPARGADKPPPEEHVASSGSDPEARQADGQAEARDAEETPPNSVDATASNESAPAEDIAPETKD